RSADTSARPFFGHYITGQEILSGRGVTEQELGHYQQLAYLTPLIAKLVFAGLQFWAGLLSLAPIMRNVSADTD
ncbi:hypothetical protein, partial [Salmonella enterica]|uniref:hypothetical protein n=1 Tax=Salmonella enterica TaxID=28901 RepID=UPI001981BD70